MSKITAAQYVKIDDSDVREPIESLTDEQLDDLNVQLADGELELAPGLQGWGHYNYTATHRHSDATYHVRIE